MASYNDELRTYTYTDEAETVIRFPSDYEFARYRDEVRSKYSAAMVVVIRYRVCTDGVDALLKHAGGLGAELRGLAYGSYQGHTFRPDGQSAFRSPDGHVRTIPCESISKAGGVIVVTSHKLKDGRTVYGLTHKPSGTSLTGEGRVSFNVTNQKRKARGFWRSLDADQKRVWQTSTNPEKLRAATPANALAVLARVYS